MSVQNLLHTPPHTESRRTSFKPGSAPCASFQARLEEAGDSANRLPPMCMGETVAASGSHAGKNGFMQSYCAHYTEDSTAEDPVVRISGVGNNGPFDVLCHLKDVDPANASYVELAALRGHLAKTGVYTNSQNSSGPLPYTMDFRDDITRKHNFIEEIQDSLTRPSHIVPTAAGVLGARELLELYQNYTSGDSPVSSQSAFDREAFMRDDLLSALSDFRVSVLNRMEKAKENEEDQDAWEKLMEYVDAWIESIREGNEDVEKSARAYAALKADQEDEKHHRRDTSDYLLERMRAFAEN
ncbi:MAG: hypothetical protein HFG04_02980 [Oscillibacter sp.]|nr:hypothetical protein [Oscillibacter sp.]